MPNEVWTVGKILEWSAPFFKTKGIDQARLDSEVLLAHTLKLSRMQLYTGYDRPLQADELAGFKALVKRRATREPVAYIIGKRGFHDIELMVDKRALIPRPETEQIVELARKALPENARFADIGTGTGAIALALLKARPDTTAIATDVSKGALALAAENAAALGLSARVEFRQGSLLAPLADDVVAAVLSNPPYVETGAELAPEVRDHEPHAALFAGTDGLSLLRELFVQGRRMPVGTLFYFEHGRGQAKALCQIASDLGYSGIRSERDLDGLARIICATATGQG